MYLQNTPIGNRLFGIWSGSTKHRQRHQQIRGSDVTGPRLTSHELDIIEHSPDDFLSLNSDLWMGEGVKRL